MERHGGERHDSEDIRLAMDYATTNRGYSRAERLRQAEEADRRGLLRRDERVGARPARTAWPWLLTIFSRLRPDRG